MNLAHLAIKSGLSSTRSPLSTCALAGPSTARFHMHLALDEERRDVVRAWAVGARSLVPTKRFAFLDVDETDS